MYSLRCIKLSKIGADTGKMGCGKWCGLVAVRLLFHLVAVIAQPEFLSIDCGGKTNYIDENNITWVTDHNYIDVGETADTGNATSPFYLQSVRFFPKPFNKSCYQLPVDPNVPYLLRLWFAVGNYQEYPKSFRYSIETLGLLTVRNETINNTDPVNGETILVSSGRLLYICLIRTSATDDPFISAIELRRLQVGMYGEATPGKMLSLISRQDAGGISLVRYPEDKFDRFWTPTGVPGPGIVNVRSTENISATNTRNIPPTIVMQTAWAANANSTLSLQNRGISNNTELLLLLYFAETKALNRTETRSFLVYINGALYRNASIPRNYSPLVVPINLSEINYQLQLVPNPDSTFGPIINAFENYWIFHTEPETYSQDIKALEVIKSRFDMKSWISDPCYITEWEGIGCDQTGSSRRISKIDLSGKKLRGSVPENIANLTSLVNLSLDNNHLTGQLPDFSSLTMLERLHLQNNNLSGRFPDWLSGLKNLKELFIDNNSFSGVIPAQLLSETSLKFTYFGNPDLHIPSNSNKDELKVILGIALSGSMVIILLLILGSVHVKKSRRKDSSSLKMESKHAVDQDNSMIRVPRTAMSRAFTLEEIRAATQNFSQKIGQGGFGSVFLGKLEQGKDIAVKVLSRFSNQGVQEFVNEVDLLSRVHHKKLMSLLGYCNESRKLMLVYEHMPGGSLRDHLYGPRAELSQLNWKTRLKIASDAAQGLEYLHLGCIPKIIHRDIKTANILLDRNFNGKLADFGLSRMAIDGEASHVITTVKGTLGYMDPEYFSTQMLTEKSDVYSFGVVLLEIICGRQPINAKLSGEELNLVRWVTPYVEMDENEGKMVEIVDKRLGTDYDIKSITSVAKLAIRCVQAEPSSRPSVKEVVAQLKEAIKLEKYKASLISEIDIDYGDLGASSACLSVDSSGPKEVDSAESSSKLPAVPQEE